MPIKGYKLSKEHKQKLRLARMGKVPWNKGIPLSEEHKKKLKENHKGATGKNWVLTYEQRERMSKARKNVPNYKVRGENSTGWKGGKPKCLGCGKEIQYRCKRCKKCRVLFATGKNSSRWKNGITPENVKIRTSIEMNLWRNSVFARDGYIDQKTGLKDSGNLVVHHILNFSSHPELRFAIDNGITLSKQSHRAFHKKYGIKNNTREQLEEFLNN